ncbi:hypothetical protein GCM10008015_05370 [Flavobacterium palustre]|uniref:DUF4410 domain-containing protein n=1 Tax=Flavobacterium palustre TaxID=1476463 RepID=A0ABQ1HB67_9FLAO|nr:hypothetical protein [Flavobacterium palustre]GGA67523.1 hypothetical protein GCM10008015_05370 [Flavobacterium palustre]
MKKIILFACILSTALFQAQTKQIFESPKLKEEITTHKTIAVLPFKSTISYKRLPKNFNPETNAQEEKKSALSLQSGLYTYLLRKSSDYSVTVQDPERTNVLLKQSGNFDKVDDLTPDALAKILGVDAVIKCTYAYQKTGSEGGAIVKSLLIGFGTGKVATSDLTMNIYNAKDGDLLWRFYKQMDEDVMSNPQAMMEHMMRKVGRNFPYEKS